MEQVPPKKMAAQIARSLKKQHPDANYVKKVFEYVRRELDLKGGQLKSKEYPELLTDSELRRFYGAIWKSANRTHVIMIKLLLYTGIRNFEVANILIKDVDLDDLKIKIRLGKGKKDRFVPIPKKFRGELAQFLSNQQERGSKYLFETNRQDKFTTRWIRKIIKDYACKAKIEKRIYPHLLRHQFLTYLTKKGVVDAKIQLISGHSDRKSLAIYQKLSLADVEGDYQAAMKEFPIE